MRPAQNPRNLCRTKYVAEKGFRFLVSIVARSRENLRSKAGRACPLGTESCIVFVAMSFRIDEDPALVDYFEAMRRAAKKTQLPFALRRMDYVEGDFEISQRILAEIDLASIVIVDFTLSSRNVYFEAGYARGRGKRLIQTARKETTLEFDARGWRTIFYKNATELEASIAQSLVSAYGDIVGIAED